MHIPTIQIADIVLPPEMERLRDLAYDLWWSWSPQATRLFTWLLALWSIQSGYLNLFDSPREQQILREQLHTLHTAHQLNLHAWEARSQLHDEAQTWRSGQ